MSIGSVLIGAIALTATATDVVKPSFPVGGTRVDPHHVTLSTNAGVKQLGPQPTAGKRFAQLTARSFDAEINVRAAPSTAADVVNVGYVGDTVEILADRYSNEDSFIWYNVRLTRGNTQGWVRGDLISLFTPSNSAEPGASASAAIAPAGQAFDSPAYPSSNLGTGSPYSAAALDYFLEVAMGSEYGDATPNVRKWNTDVRIQLMTQNATPQDTAALNQVITDLNRLLRQAAGPTGRPITVSLVNSNPNVQMYFVPAESFAQYNSNARAGMVGSAWMQVNNNIINGAQILISSNYLTDVERAHVIREELTQSLGIMKDSWRYPDSVFYEGWSSPTRYTEIDEEVIRMLYNPQLTTGMSQQQVARTLQR